MLIISSSILIMFTVIITVIGIFILGIWKLIEIIRNRHKAEK